MKKVIRDGKVAVLVSPGYGAGWSTWAYSGDEDCNDFMLFDPTLVDMIENCASTEEIEAYVTAKYPDGYYGGADGLTIEWLPVGTQFRVHEYDGSETLEFKEAINWITA